MVGLRGFDDVEPVAVRVAERRENPGAYRGFRFSTQLGEAYPRAPSSPSHPPGRATRAMMLLADSLDYMIGFLRILVIGKQRRSDLDPAHARAKGGVQALLESELPDVEVERSIVVDDGIATVLICWMRVAVALVISASSGHALHSMRPPQRDELIGPGDATALPAYKLRSCAGAGAAARRRWRAAVRRPALDCDREVRSFRNLAPS